jgi:hypothetical protein
MTGFPGIRDRANNQSQAEPEVDPYPKIAIEEQSKKKNQIPCHKQYPHPYKIACGFYFVDLSS